MDIDANIQQTELQQISGDGKVFKIDGEKFEVLPATLGQLEEVADMWNEKVHPWIIANFTKDKVDNKEALYKLLGMAFDGKVPEKKLKKLRRNQVKEIINFFLVE